MKLSEKRVKFCGTEGLSRFLRRRNKNSSGRSRAHQLSAAQRTHLAVRTGGFYLSRQTAGFCRPPVDPSPDGAAERNFRPLFRYAERILRSGSRRHCVSKSEQQTGPFGGRSSRRVAGGGFKKHH